jgi:hypothetical protein
MFNFLFRVVLTRITCCIVVSFHACRIAAVRAARRMGKVTSLLLAVGLRPTRKSGSRVRLVTAPH